MLNNITNLVKTYQTAADYNVMAYNHNKMLYTSYAVQGYLNLCLNILFGFKIWNLV